MHRTHCNTILTFTLRRPNFSYLTFPSFQFKFLFYLSFLFTVIPTCFFLLLDSWQAQGISSQEVFTIITASNINHAQSVRSRWVWSLMAHHQPHTVSQVPPENTDIPAFHSAADPSASLMDSDPSQALTETLVTHSGAGVTPSTASATPRRFLPTSWRHFTSSTLGITTREKL